MKMQKIAPSMRTLVSELRLRLGMKTTTTVHRIKFSQISKMDLGRYINKDPWQFQKEFAAMPQMDRMQLLRKMDNDDVRAALLPCAQLLLNYCIEGNQLIRYYGLPWDSDLSVPVEMSNRIG